MNRKLRFGMVGGGIGSFVGGIHRIAATMDGEAELVAGAFSSDPARSMESGRLLCIEPGRTYGDYRRMAAAEAQVPADRRLDFVVVATPNDQHYAPARLFLESGFNVVCDKPLAFDLRQARSLKRIVGRTGKVFVLTHNYTGNAMVRQARDLVREGRLGTIRKVVVEYPQGWLATAVEATGQKQAVWRADPKRNGAGGSVGDIGTHAENLARFITGLRIEALCAELTRFVKGRKLDDDCNVLLRFKGGARGVLHCSQVCIGEDNGLNIRVYGEKASLEWHQERPEELIVKHADGPNEVWRRGKGFAGASVRRATRIPAGHPEGYLEAFANVYRDAFRAIAAEVAGRKPPPGLDFPTIDDGVEGMAFIDTVVRSARLGARWVRFPRKG